MLNIIFMEESFSERLFALRVGPDGQLVCVIGDDQYEPVGFFPAEERGTFFRDLFVLMKATLYDQKKIPKKWG